MKKSKPFYKPNAIQLGNNLITAKTQILDAFVFHFASLSCNENCNTSFHSLKNSKPPNSLNFSSSNQECYKFLQLSMNWKMPSKT